MTHSTWTRLAALILAVPVLTSSLAAASPEDYRQEARRCRELLQKSVVEFYLPACVDRRHGGYLEVLKDGKFSPTGEKFLVLQARQLWFFSTLAREGIAKEQALEAARVGYEFLQKHFLDKEQGGYFSKVSDEGRPVDRRKHAYLNSFALYGLTAYHRAAGDAGALKAAQALFRVLEEKFHDGANGGYTEFLTEDFRPITDPKEQGFIGAIGTKTYNTHLHLMEAFAELYRAWPDELLRKRLVELVAVNTNTVRHQDHACNVDAWRADWTRIDTRANLRASYGHDVECVWLALDAAEAAGLSPRLLMGWASALCDYSLENGYDRRHGGFFYGGPVGLPADDTRKEWWVQAEALVAMADMHRRTGRPELFEAFRGTLDFVARHQVAPGGSWWATRAADGSAMGDTRTSPWQGAYHNGRALLLCAKLLEALAEHPPEPPRGR